MSQYVADDVTLRSLANAVEVQVYVNWAMPLAKWNVCERTVQAVQDRMYGVELHNETQGKTRQGRRFCTRDNNNVVGRKS